MMHLWSHPTSDAQLVDLRLQARGEARRKRALRVRKIDSDDILPVQAGPDTGTSSEYSNKHHHHTGTSSCSC
jgi:hypothetical protein